MSIRNTLSVATFAETATREGGSITYLSIVAPGNPLPGRKYAVTRVHRRREVGRVADDYRVETWTDHGWEHVLTFEETTPAAPDDASAPAHPADARAAAELAHTFLHNHPA